MLHQQDRDRIMESIGELVWELNSAVHGPRFDAALRELEACLPARDRERLTEPLVSSHGEWLRDAIDRAIALVLASGVAERKGPRLVGECPTRRRRSKIDPEPPGAA